MGSKLIETQVIKFWLPGRVVPKSRPRVTKHGTYLPQNYRDWRQVAQAELLMQVSDRSLLPLSYPVAVRILLQGKHGGDIDNLSGSILDALVACEILKDDRLSCVPRLVVEHQPAGQSGCHVQVEAV